MKKLIYFLLLCFTTFNYAQVTGNVHLYGETVHAGIKVLFTALTPSAVSDSTITDTNGDYSKTLFSGAYSIRFSKSGYISVDYS